MLNKLEKTLIKKLEHATQVLNDSHKSIQSLKQQLDDARTETASLKSKLTDGPSFPAGFKCSPAVQHALSTSKAQLATAQKLLNDEITHFQSKQIQDIHDRNAAAAKESAYQKALNSSYAVATAAINARKTDIQQNGVSLTVGYSGYQCKGDFDPKTNQLFSFELFAPNDTIEINAQEYAITKREISQINAGNRYHLQPVRK